MWIEIQGKGGSLCQPAQQGTLRCPLMVRASSEDVVTSFLFENLSLVNPRWWLPSLLNTALQINDFQKQVYRDFKISLWVNQPRSPRHLIPWAEGSTQVDVVIEWENPPTTLFIEMKYGSDLSKGTARNQGQYGYPADQLIRNIRVGLFENGYFEEPSLFEKPKRDFLMVVISPDANHELVERYRNPVILRKAIPHSDLIAELPNLPFLGELSYQNLIEVLQDSSRCCPRIEEKILGSLISYLRFKLDHRPRPFDPIKALPLFEDSPE